MKWQQTTASQCRWSEYPEEMFYDWEILWEDSEADYQGHAAFIAYKDGRFAYMSWSYGSCSGCDGWEDLSEDQRRADFKNLAEYFESVSEFEEWVKHTGTKEMAKALAECRRLFDEMFTEDFESYNVH